MPEPVAKAIKLTPEDWKIFKELMVEAGWLDSDTSEETVRGMIAGAEVFGAEIPGCGTVAVGRGISDGCSDAYIQDVFVLPAFRGKGIGKVIVRSVTAALRNKGCDWIGLIATPGNENFYRSMGFEPMAGHTPMFFTEKR